MKKWWLRSRKPRLMAVGIRCADHTTPSTSPTSSGCSVSIVRLQTRAMEFSLVLVAATTIY
jgi:hypothetical protein